MNATQFKLALAYGHLREFELASKLAASGWHVIRVADGWSKEDEKSGAPKILAPCGTLFTAPDFICFDSQGNMIFVESKAKGHPLWFYNGGDWYHGFDAKLWSDYRLMDSIAPLYIAVNEEMSLPFDGFEPPPEDRNLPEWQRGYERHLVPSGEWLYMRFPSCGGWTISRGSGGKKLVSWPRHLMESNIGILKGEL
jgi:hypothetical protein